MTLHYTIAELNIEILWIKVALYKNCERFHLGNLQSEFHHAVQFWLDFEIVQIQF